jgi:hypothetical protein
MYKILVHAYISDYYMYNKKIHFTIYVIIVLYGSLLGYLFKYLLNKQTIKYIANIVKNDR